MFCQSRAYSSAIAIKLMRKEVGWRARGSDGGGKGVAESGGGAEGENDGGDGS